MDRATSLRAYALVTGAYWGFTLTDGALRMLVLLHFHKLGYSPLELAFLFLLYEFCGVLTNLFGGWVGGRFGLHTTLFAGLALQVVALLALSLVSPDWLKGFSVAYVMGAQALSGIAKDLTKMSSKSAVKVVTPEGDHGALFKWVALLTGSKNALKGAGFFLGGLLLSVFGFAGGLYAMAGGLALVLILSLLFLPRGLGQVKAKVKMRHLFSKSPKINRLSLARFFLFGSRDTWFVVGLPVYLSEALGWSFTGIGGFLAVWVIGYGIIQACAPLLLRGSADGASARNWAFILVLVPAGIAGALWGDFDPTATVTGGLVVFGMIFAVNSAVHSFLILDYSGGESVALDVGFYYMANAAGRLAGTLLSGLLFQIGGFTACLLGSAALVLSAGLVSLTLPAKPVRV